MTRKKGERDVRRARRGGGKAAEITVLAVVIAVSGVVVTMLGDDEEPQQTAAVMAPEGLTVNRQPQAEFAAANVSAGDFTYERIADPARTVVRDADGRVRATLTDGARTVVTYGARRRLAEDQFPGAAVNTTAYVHLLPRPWQQGMRSEPWFGDWLRKKMSGRQPDLLAIGMQYVDGVPDKRDANGVRTRGDASFGPLNPESRIGRDQQNDFYDYLGISWDFGAEGVQYPERRRYGAVDCSGYVRLVYGYRGGYPLSSTATATAALPRRAHEIGTVGPGIQIIPDRQVKATAYGRLQPGDLLFFDNDPTTGPRLDHVGIYLGIDTEGHHRFLSSRAKVDGPTMSDVGGASLLDSGGLYSRAFRSAKRL
ncbi:NlpC/P60 family protein [Haloechinothrix salitolerans]|uniref:NlpC/P60 family protein n=1 Tax=Haloechinothrix salitolerans TaxID=926830 RepID=A0ABW2BUY5_9PSEU